MKITLDVCDVCQDKNKPTKMFKVGTETTLKRKSLCDVHARPLVDLIGKAAGRGFKTTTPEEVQERLSEQARLGQEKATTGKRRPA